MGTFLVLSHPVTVNAAPYVYNSFGDTAGSKVTIIQSSFEEKKYFTCDFLAISCSNESPIPTSLIKLDTIFENKNYFFNSTKDKIFASEEIVLNGKKIIQNALYSVSDGKPVLESVLSSHERVYRALFSEDGTRVLLITRDGNLVSINTNTRAIVFKKKFKDKASASRITFSPNGKFLAYFIPKKGSSGIRSFKLWDLAHNKIYTQSDTLAYWDLLSEDLKIFEFSPDSSTLFYLDDRDNFATLYRVNLKDEIKLLGEKIVSGPFITADFSIVDSNSLYFVANRENPFDWSLYHYDISSDVATKIADKISYSQSMKKIGNEILFLRMDTNAANPWVLDMNTKKISLLPLPNQAFRKMRINQSVASFSGVSAVVSLPHNFSQDKSYPLLVWLHGGPYRQTNLDYHPYQSYAGYDAILEEVTINGAIVLKVDYAGSYGYGRDFAENIMHNVGRTDVADVLNSIKYAEKKFNIDGVYLMGNSYGGYLALRTIVEKPLEIDGAISVNGVTDWEMLLDDLRTSIFNVHFGGLAKKHNQKLYDQASILDRIDNLTNNKIMLVKGERDTTISPKQSDALFDALLAKEKSVSLINYGDEDHIIRKRDNLRDLCRKTLNLIKLRVNANSCKL